MYKVELACAHLLYQAWEISEVFQMRGLLFYFLPQVLDGIEIRRIRRQLELGQAVLMLNEELIHGFGSVIFGSILDQDDVLVGLG